MNRVRILNTYFDAGVAKYVAGETYPLNDETGRLVARGDAVEVGAEVESGPPEEAPAPQADPQTEETVAAETQQVRRGRRPAAQP